MERKVLAINLDKDSTRSTEELNRLFEYAFVEGVTDFIIFSNGILDRRFSVKDELTRLASTIPSIINTTVFLGYKDGFRISSKDIEDVSRDSLGFILGNHTSYNALGHNINFFNGEYNIGELDKVFGNINLFASKTSTGIDNKSLKFGNHIMHVGPFNGNEGWVATELSIEDGFVMNYGIVSSSKDGFKKEDIYKVELDKDRFSEVKNGNKCLIKM